MLNERFRISMLTPAVLLFLASGAFAGTMTTIDFETDGLGNSLAAGTVIDDEYTSLGLTLSTDQPFGLMIFDSSNPTGDDEDLGSPNEDTPGGGPGVGAGGAPGGIGPNGLPLGNLLIISEDGDSNEPDDSLAGGLMIFEFDNPVFFHEIVLLDDISGSFDFVFQNGSTESFDFSQDGENTLLSYDFTSGPFAVTKQVSTFTLNLDGSGAVASISFAAVPSPSSLTLLSIGAGFFGLLGIRSLRHKKQDTTA